MKLIQFAIIFTSISFMSIFTANSQCIDFAKEDGFLKLDTALYIPDGRLNAIPLSEGDNLDVYKPFFRGRQYRVVVVGAANLPKVNFKVANFQKQVIFDSKKSGNDSWEFVSDKNQNLIISVDIPAAESGTPKTGCIAVLIGFKQQ